MANLNRLEEVNLETLDEHVFELFSLRNPETSHGLGFIDRANNISISIGSHDFEVRQSLSMLNSKTESSTTGAVVWKVAPIFAEWLWKKGTPFDVLLTPGTTILELGAGIGGVLPSVLAEMVDSYIVTDQSHIIKLALANIENNTQPRTKSKIKCFTYDWEHKDSCVSFVDLIRGLGSKGVVVATDTIYNEYLIPHFVQAVSHTVETMGPGSHVLLAQQLRDGEIFEGCLRAFLVAGFHVFSVPEHHLSSELGNGFAVHYLTKTCLV